MPFVLCPHAGALICIRPISTSRKAIFGESVAFAIYLRVARNLCGANRWKVVEGTDIASTKRIGCGSTAQTHEEAYNPVTERPKSKRYDSVMMVIYEVAGWRGKNF